LGSEHRLFPRWHLLLIRLWIHWLAKESIILIASATLVSISIGNPNLLYATWSHVSSLRGRRKDLY
jgi:hypothetical protein